MSHMIPTKNKKRKSLKISLKGRRETKHVVGQKITLETNTEEGGNQKHRGRKTTPETNVGGGRMGTKHTTKGRRESKNGGRVRMEKENENGKGKGV